MKPAFKITALIASLLFLWTIPGFGAVSTIKEDVTTQNCIYVAGCPDNYPFEYYNEATEQYEGVFPDLLFLISQDLQVDFVYVSSGTLDYRTLLGRNKQVELISALNQSQSTPFTKTKPVITLNQNGKTVSYCFAFTSLANEDFIEAFCHALYQIPQAQTANLALSYAMNPPRDHRLTSFLLISSGILLILVIGMIFQFRRYQKLKAQAEYDLYIDPLTEIGNKSYFKQCYDRDLTPLVRPSFYSYYIGFDARKIRDLFGEDVYSGLSVYTAKLLSRRLFSGDFVSRVAAGEFCAVHAANNEKEARSFAETLISELNSFDQKNDTSTGAVFHCGIYHISKEDADAKRVIYDTMLGYKKASEMRLSAFLINSSGQSSEANRELLQKQILTALEHNEITLYLQFVVNASSNKVCAAEALSRWEHPDQGTIRAGDYIQLVHEAGMIEEYDLYIFKEVCQLLSEFDRAGIYLPISCNVTQKSLSDVGFFSRVCEITAEYSFDVRLLTLEITEDSIISNYGAAMENIRRFKEKGFRLSIDDMGTGYTALSSLATLPVDIVKIDRQIILSALKPQGRRLLNGIVALIHNMGMKVLCEGIETKELDSIAKEAGCDYIQGFWYWRAIPAFEAKRILTKKALEIKKALQGQQRQSPPRRYE